ncbi:AAA family ATPase [Cylindrospermopsis raciborskii]|uniref:AAA family ATPase n=1 Tax=Cylindrospermopsis raciborskii TaxID=77022 RepID=UPI0021552AE2|nr:AAA family ATPase [Cylindrospermopsis raciborskii]
MFIDTLKEIFEGNQKLFEGLYIHDQWDWSRKFPLSVREWSMATTGLRQETPPS